MRKLIAIVCACAGIIAVNAETIDLKETGPKTLTTQAEVDAGLVYTNTGDDVVDLTISTGEGVVLTNNATISGKIRLVKTGAGRLKIKSQNSYTGGTLWSAGYLEAYTTEAFGAAKSTVTCQTSAETWFYLRAAGDYDYTFDMQNTGTLYWKITKNVNVLGPVVDSAEKGTGVIWFLWNNLTGTFKSSFSHPKGQIGTGGTSVVIDGDFTAKSLSGGTCYGKFDWEDIPYSQWSSQQTNTRSYAGTLTLNGAKNTFASFSGAYAGFSVTKANSLPESLYVTWGDCYSYSNFGMNTADQTIDRLEPEAKKAGAANENYRRITSTGPVTLTLKGSQSASTWARLDNQVSLVYDPLDAAYSQKFIGDRAHPTTGTLTSKGGTLELGGGTTWKNLTGIVLAGGDVKISTTNAAPFDATKLTLTVGDAGKIVLDRAITVKSAIQGGQQLSPTTYTRDNCSWIDGAGSVTVSEMSFTQAEYLAYAATHDSLEIPAGGTLVFKVTEATDDFNVGIRLTGAGAVKVTGGKYDSTLKKGGKITVSGDNTFSGGMTVSSSVTASGRYYPRTVIASSTACGTGTLTVDNVHAQVYISKNLTLANPIHVAASAALGFGSGVTLTGDVQADASLNLLQGSVRFAGKVTLADATNIQAGDGCQVAFDQSVKASKIADFTGNGFNTGDVEEYGAGSGHYVHGGSLLQLKASGNEATTLGVCRWNVQLAAANALNEDVMLAFGTGATGTRGYTFTSCAQVDLNGYDLTVDRVSTAGSGYTITDYEWKSSDTIDYITSSKGGTLTMKGLGSGWTYAALKGNVSVNWAPQGDYTFAFSNRVNTMSGKLTVSRGTLMIGGKCTFPNLGELEVKPGAKFVNASLSPNSLVSLRNLVVGDSSTSEVTLPEGLELTVDSLVVDGEPQANADLTPGPDCPWLKGSSVKILVRNSRNIWVPQTGSWGTAANWAVGVPSATLDAQVLSWGSKSVTATVDAEAGSVNGLTVGTTVGASGTATVAVKSSLGMVAGKNLEILDKGVVEIQDGGAFALPASSKAYVRAGGELKMTGGTFAVKNVDWAADAIRTYDGAAVNLSGTARLGVENGTTATHLFGGGVTTFAGSSSIGGSSPSGIYLNPPDAGCSGVVRVVEHAAWFPRGESKRPVFLNIGTTAGRPMYMEYSSDAASWLSQALRIGEGKGTGELTVSAGSILLDYAGLCIGAAYEQHGVLCTPTGFMNVTGGTVEVMGGTDFSGTIIGAGNTAATDANGNFLDNLFRGRLEISGDAYYRNSGNSQVVVGVGQAEAELNQSGGTLTAERADLGGASIIGMAGAKGVWTMTGGTATLSGYLYVGGITTNELGRQVSGGDGTGRRYPAELGPNGTGKLALSGGTMTVAKDLVLSAEGLGTLKLKPGAKLAVAGNLDARTGSKLVIDCRGYAGRSKTLATFGGTTTAFADVEFLKDDAAEYTCKITGTMIRISSNAGSVLLVR